MPQQDTYNYGGLVAIQKPIHPSIFARSPISWNILYFFLIYSFFIIYGICILTTNNCLLEGDNTKRLYNWLIHSFSIVMIALFFICLIVYIILLIKRQSIVVFSPLTIFICIYMICVAIYELTYNINNKVQTVVMNLMLLWMWIFIPILYYNNPFITRLKGRIYIDNKYNLGFLLVSFFMFISMIYLSIQYSKNNQESGGIFTLFFTLFWIGLGLIYFYDIIKNNLLLINLWITIALILFIFLMGAISLYAFIEFCYEKNNPSFIINILNICVWFIALISYSVNLYRNYNKDISTTI